MTNGSRAYADLSRQIEALRSETGTQARQLAALSTELEQVQAQEGRQIARLAGLRLGELAARPHGERIDAADRAALAQLARRDTELQRLDASLAESGRTQAELERQRAQLDGELDRMRANDESARAAVIEQARNDPAWRQLDDQAERLSAQATFAREKADQAQADRLAKGKPYEDDALFTYLWRRQYGSDGYRAGALVRLLDRWVAGLVGYREAARNYRLLLALPEKLHQHAERLGAEAEQAMTAVEAHERNLLEAAGVTKLEAKLAQAEAELDAATGRLHDEEARHAELLAARTALVEGEDEHSRAALAGLAQAIASASTTQLQRVAAATADAEDDAVVAEIERLRGQRQRLVDELAAGKRDHEQRLAALARVEELRQRFREQRYDSQQSEFSAGLDWSALVNGVLRGAIESGRAWQQVQRHQRFRLPPTPRSPSPPRAGTRSPRPFGGSRPGGSSGGRSGGIGGGGFRTGGGF